MEWPRPSVYGNRPAYLDKLFFHEPLPLPPRTTSPIPHSTKSSVSSLSSELHTNESNARQLSPAFESDSFDDRISVRSLRQHLSPRFKLRSFLSRQTYPHVQETVEFESARPYTSYNSSSPKLVSLSRPTTPFSSSPAKRYRSSSKPPVPTSPAKVEQLHCTPCYYFAARNCHGYVLGGCHGDACENCAASGFFGAP